MRRPDRTHPPRTLTLDIAPQSFPAARYRFGWRITRALRLPDYAGSMLRGAFGHALRKVACLTKQKACDGRPLLGACAYSARSQQEALIKKGFTSAIRAIGAIRYNHLRILKLAYCDILFDAALSAAIAATRRDT